MSLNFIQCGQTVPQGCREVFYGSEIYRRYFTDEKLDRTLARAAQAGELYLCVDETGKVLGVLKMLLRGFCGMYPYLGLLGVHPDSRGLGVGSFVLRSAEELARETGAKRITLMVADFNEGAIRLYQRLGYRIATQFDNAVLEGVAEVLMVKDL